jgi:hypothetical protein
MPILADFHFWMGTSEASPSWPIPLRDGQTHEAFARDGHSPPSLRAVGSTSRKPGRTPYGPEARRYLRRRRMAKGSLRPSSGQARLRAFIRMRSLALSSKASPKKDASEAHSGLIFEGLRRVSPGRIYGFHIYIHLLNPQRSNQRLQRSWRCS